MRVRGQLTSICRTASTTSAALEPPPSLPHNRSTCGEQVGVGVLGHPVRLEHRRPETVEIGHGRRGRRDPPSTLVPSQRGLTRRAYDEPQSRRSHFIRARGCRSSRCQTTHSSLPSLRRSIRSPTSARQSRKRFATRSPARRSADVVPPGRASDRGGATARAAASRRRGRSAAGRARHGAGRARGGWDPPATRSRSSLPEGSASARDAVS